MVKLNYFNVFLFFNTTATMATSIVYTPPSTTVENDEVINENAIGQKMFNYRLVKMADGSSMTFRLEPVNISNTWFGM